MNDTMAKTQNPLVSLIGGIVFTMILVIVVPVLVYVVIEPILTPIIEDAFGSDTYPWLFSSSISAVVMFIVLILFMLLLGGGAILKRFGLIGIVGLVVAFWLLGDIKGAIIPIAVVILVWIITVIRKKK